MVFFLLVCVTYGENMLKRVLVSLVCALLAAGAVAGTDDVHQKLANHPTMSYAFEEVVSGVYTPGVYGVVRSRSESLASLGMVTNESASVALYDVRRDRLYPKMMTMSAPDSQLWNEQVLRSMDLSRALSFRFGSGDRRLVMFSSPDCGYCARLERRLEQLAPRLNATLYVIPVPLDTTRADAIFLRNVMCSPSPERVWRNWMVRRTVVASVPACDAPGYVDGLIAFQSMGARKTPTIFAEDGGLVDVSYLSDDTQIIRAFTPAGKPARDLRKESASIELGSAFAPAASPLADPVSGIGKAVKGLFGL